MLSVVEVFLLLISLILAIPSAFLLIECIAALVAFPEKITEERRRPSNIAVVVPAHNESDYIVNTLESIVPQLNLPNSLNNPPNTKFITDRLIVIADNCTDDTAKLASRIKGVTVIERENTHLRGKGHALDFALNYLSSQPPNIVIVVDGDCIVEENTIDNIARLLWESNRPVQATYLMDVPSSPSPKDIISAFALTVKNSVRPKGLTRLSLPCLLTGSGMAFSWDMIKQVSFANSKTVDDMLLGLDLAIAGYPPLHCHSGLITGRLMKDKSAKSQKKRWVHGHIETIFTKTPLLLKLAITQKNFDLLWLAVELCIPPISLLIALWFASIIIASSLGIIIDEFSFVPLGILVIEGIFIFLSLFMAWVKFAFNNISVKEILHIPYYFLWNIPLHSSFIFKRQTYWSKTERD